MTEQDVTTGVRRVIDPNTGREFVTGKAVRKVSVTGNDVTVDLGLENVEIEDKSDCSGYHIPEGCLVIYDPRDQSAKAVRPDISTLELAPAILQNYAIPVPDYMSRPVALGIAMMISSTRLERTMSGTL